MAITTAAVLDGAGRTTGAATKDTHEAKLGPLELSVKDKETVNVPEWAGVGAIVIGGALLLIGGKKR